MNALFVLLKVWSKAVEGIARSRRNKPIRRDSRSVRAGHGLPHSRTTRLPTSVDRSMLPVALDCNEHRKHLVSRFTRGISLED